MFNPFLMTKQNYAPTFMIVPQPQKKSISIMPIEEEKNISDEIAKSALKLETPRKISIGGDATGAALFDGAGDTEIKIIVKAAEKATKDSEGKNISKTYATKADLNDFAKKSDVAAKLNYLETVLYETKNTINAFQAELNAAKESVTNIQNDLEETKETVNNSVIGSVDGENVTFAADDDIDSLFGD